MSDLRITVFGGIRNDVTAKEINPGQFVDGQNFNIDLFGSLTKRKGCSKVYTTQLTGHGAVVMIADLITKWGKRKHYYVESFDYHYSDDPVIPYPGIDPNNPPVDPPGYDDPITATGCCNYGDYPGTCIVNVTLTTCLDTYNGAYWREGGTCQVGDTNNCLRGGDRDTVTTTSSSTSTTSTTTTSTSTSSSSSTSTVDCGCDAFYLQVDIRWSTDNGATWTPSADTYSNYIVNKQLSTGSYLTYDCSSGAIDPNGTLDPNSMFICYDVSHTAYYAHYAFDLKTSTGQFLNHVVGTGTNSGTFSGWSCVTGADWFDCNSSFAALNWLLVYRVKITKAPV